MHTFTAYVPLSFAVKSAQAAEEPASVLATMNVPSAEARRTTEGREPFREMLWEASPEALRSFFESLSLRITEVS